MANRIPLAKPLVTKEVEEKVIAVLRSGRFILGEENLKLEEGFANFCGCRHGIAVNSGTSALYLALMAAGVGRGDEVITVSHSFFATAEVVMALGAKPVLVDIDPQTYTIDPAGIEAKVNRKTKAILPVHLYGHPSEMGLIKDLAQQHNLRVVVDACQAHGAMYKGSLKDCLGDVACFSFYPSKIINVCGDGGMIVTDNETIAEKARMLRDHGRRLKHLSDVVGYNMRLNEINAAIGRVQLKNINAWIRRRRSAANNYNQLLSTIKEVRIPFEAAWAYHVYTYYVIRAEKRNELLAWLRGRGIEAMIHYPVPIHRQPAFTQKFGYVKLKDTEVATEQVISLPMYASICEEEITRVVDEIKIFYGNT